MTVFCCLQNVFKLYILWNGQMVTGKEIILMKYSIGGSEKEDLNGIKL